MPQIVAPRPTLRWPPAARRVAAGGAPSHARRLAWGAVAAALALMVIAPVATGLAVEYRSFAGLLWLIPCFGPLLVYLRFRGLDRLRSALETALAMLVLTLPVLVLSYAAMRLALPIADLRLERWDRALGLDAMAMVRWVGAVPMLAAWLGVAYASFGIQLLSIPFVVAMCGRGERAYDFVTGFAAICIASIAISACFPSLGTFAHHAADPGALGAVDPFFGYHFLESFHAVRDDPAFVLSTGVVSGIVTFPSIHAAIAVLCGWAAWPIRGLRWPVAVLNAGMFASAVTHGAHFVVDTIAGGAIAALFVWAIGRVRAARPATGRAAPAGAAAAPGA